MVDVDVDVDIVMVTLNIPPVAGTRDTSPREVENVDRSSWANYIIYHRIWELGFEY